MYKNILVPMDGSPHSERALQEVIKLCRGNEKATRVTLMHVVPTVSQDLYNTLEESDFNVSGFVERQGEEVLQGAAEELTKAGIPFEMEVAMGDPAQEIYIESKYGNYDLIVMGSRGHGYFRELMLGSVTQKVLHHVNCPVLIVK